MNNKPKKELEEKSNNDSFLFGEITKNKKIILSVLLLILLLIPIFLNARKFSNNIEVENYKSDYNKKEFSHKEKGILKEEKISGIKFFNIKLYTKDGQTTFTADVTNVLNKDIETENFDIDLLDKKNNVVITLRANIPNGLKVGETKSITASAKGEFKNVVSKKIKQL